MNRSLLRRSGPWLLVGLVAAILGGLLVYSLSSDSYVATAVTTAPPNEAVPFDISSISGLAALGGGGQRTTFEEFAYLLKSDANVREVLTTRRNSHPLGEFETAGGLERSLLGFERSARRLFGKPDKQVDSLDRLVSIAQRQLEVTKTPEGYMAITLKGQTPNGKVDMLRALIALSDETVRRRAIADYRSRIATYQQLVDREQRPAARAILVSLIAREYTTYASAQSGQVFAFAYVDAPQRVTKAYAPSLLLILIVAGALWFALSAAYLIARSSLLNQ